MAGADNDSGLRQRPVSGAPNLTVAKVYVPTIEGQKRGKQLDKHTEYVPLLASAYTSHTFTTLDMSLAVHGVSWPS